jgi:hypothetical protein
VSPAKDEDAVLQPGQKRHTPGTDVVTCILPMINYLQGPGRLQNATSPVQLAIIYPCKLRYTGPEADGLHRAHPAVAGPAFGIHCGPVKSRTVCCRSGVMPRVPAYDQDFDRWLDLQWTGITGRSPRVATANSSESAVRAETKA